MSPPAGFLQVEGENIVLNGKPIVLKGAAVGGWSGLTISHDQGGV